ncbi:MAG: hypothetical protein K5656_07065 [Lachnospiraceae bacterium]|nr:hypothetical protein [Lachnospiraceae bacterium]
MSDSANQDNNQQYSRRERPSRRRNKTSKPGFLATIINIINNSSDAAKNYSEEKVIRAANRVKLIKDGWKKASPLKRMRIIVGTGIVLILIAATLELVLEGTLLKKSGLIENTPLEKIVEALPSKEYKTYDKETENQILFKKLMKHFDNNTTAVLGVMCNLNSESKFKANNLEDYNNEMWGIDDDDYTEKVNTKIIDKKDFLESRHAEYSNGYYNEYGQWVNVDGGYGYGQYTAYGKKEGLYQFAERWFGPDGEGEKYKFNIADPEMQASYVVHLLNSDEYKSMDSRIRSAASVVDACYIWLKEYEIPFDPYNDGYYTLAFDRAYAADDILASCDATAKASTIEAAKDKAKKESKKSKDSK